MFPNAVPTFKLTPIAARPIRQKPILKQCCLPSSTTQTFPISTCASHKKRPESAMFLTDLKSGKPAMAQTTKKKLGLGSAISQAERKDYQSKFDEQAEFPPDTLSDSERNELRKLGFDRNKICYLSEDVLSMGSRRMSMAFALGYLTGREVRASHAPRYPVPVPSRVLVLIGIHYVENVPDWRSIGLQMLNIASTMQNHEASIYLCMYEYSDSSNHKYQAPNHAHKVVADLAAAGTDWRAMSMHVRDLIQAQNRPKAMALATRICSITEPVAAKRKAVSSSSWLDRFPLPWKTLVESLDPNDEEAEKRAYKYGAEVWDDPQACARHAHFLQPGSQPWLKYVTKAAMAGRVQSMQQVGFYHLALHGWYPRKKQPSETYDSRIGFHWLQLGATFVEPYRAAEIWAGLALLSREHGDRGTGMKYLQDGISELGSRHIYKHQAQSKEDGLRLLSQLLAQWGDKQLVNKTTQKIIDTETFFGDPIIPIP